MCGLSLRTSVQTRHCKRIHRETTTKWHEIRPLKAKSRVISASLESWDQNSWKHPWNHIIAVSCLLWDGLNTQKNSHICVCIRDCRQVSSLFLGPQSDCTGLNWGLLQQHVAWQEQSRVVRGQEAATGLNQASLMAQEENWSTRTNTCSSLPPGYRVPFTPWLKVCGHVCLCVLYLVRRGWGQHYKLSS